MSNVCDTMILTGVFLSLQEKEKEAVEPRSQPPHLPRQVCNSPSVVSDVTSRLANTPAAWEPVPPFTLLPSWSTCAPRFWNLQETLLVTTRSLVLCPVTSPLPSRTTRNWTSCLEESPSLLEVSCPTSTLSCCPRRANKHFIHFSNWNPTQKKTHKLEILISTHSYKDATHVLYPWFNRLFRCSFRDSKIRCTINFPLILCPLFSCSTQEPL